MTEAEGEYKINVVSVSRPGPNPGETPMQYRGGDVTPEILAVYCEYDYSCYQMAREIIRLRAEYKKLLDEVNRG